MTIVVEGSMCLVKDGPGQAEFSAVYRAQSAIDPMVQIKRQMTELGVPFATQMTVRMGGDAMTKEVGFSDRHDRSRVLHSLESGNSTRRWFVT